MTHSTDDLAALSADAYRTRERSLWKQGVEVSGVQYEILHQESDGPVGYQGTIYQRKDTGGIVVAHRGTEFDRQLVADGVFTDGGMVFVGSNAQASAAMALTERAIAIAHTQNESRCEAPTITVTGHSLGGTLAQITAHRLGLRAETFDAYGAAGLTSDLPRHDPDIVNHVRATDFVSAGSRHIGEQRIYAVPEDIDALSRNGYENGRPIVDLRNPLGVALGVGIRAHFSDNFLADGQHGRSIINDDDRARAAANAEMIADYRRDIARIHNGLALPRNVIDGVGDLGGRLLGRQAPDPAPPSAFVPGACAAPQMRLDPSQPGHPDHALHQQSLRAVQALDVAMGRTSDVASERLAASALHGAKQAGLERIDHVALSTDTAHARAGAHVFVVQGAITDPAHRRVTLETQNATATSVDESYRRIDAINQSDAQRVPAPQLIDNAAVQSAPVMR